MDRYQMPYESQNLILQKKMLNFNQNLGRKFKHYKISFHFIIGLILK